MKKIYTDQEWNKIIKSDTYCPAPFLAYYLHTTNEMAACCTQNNVPGIEKISDSFDKMYNINFFKNLRKDLLNGVKNSACDRCWKTEKISSNSLRKAFNGWQDTWNSSEDIRSSINEDYSLTDPNIRYLDIRFDNTCNLRCRSCTGEYSTSWYPEETLMRAQSIPGVSLTGVRFHNVSISVDDLKPALKTVKRIYFAGGEPMVTPQHYEILEYLIEINHTDVDIYYNTNFSKLKHSKWDVIELWKNFSNVTVGASLDGSWERGEYARKNLSWEQVIKNRQRMIDEVPHVEFNIATTVSIFNAYDFVKHHKEWVENKLIGPADLTINLLFGPYNYQLSNLPDHHKEKLKTLYKEHIEWIKTKITQSPNIAGTIDPMKMHWWAGTFKSGWNIDLCIQGIEGLINQLDQPRNLIDYIYWRKDLWLDHSRNENFFKTFPEYQDLRSEIFNLFDEHYPDLDYSLWKF